MRHWRPLTKSILLFVFPLAVISTLADGGDRPRPARAHRPRTRADARRRRTRAELGGLAVTARARGADVPDGQRSRASRSSATRGWARRPTSGGRCASALRRARPAFLLTLVWTVASFGAVAADHPRDLAGVAWCAVRSRRCCSSASGRSRRSGARSRWSRAAGGRRSCSCSSCWLLVDLLGSVVSAGPVGRRRALRAGERVGQRRSPASIGTTLSRRDPLPVLLGAC